MTLFESPLDDKKSIDGRVGDLLFKPLAAFFAATVVPFLAAEYRFSSAPQQAFWKYSWCIPILYVPVFVLLLRRWRLYKRTVGERSPGIAGTLFWSWGAVMVPFCIGAATAAAAATVNGMVGQQQDVVIDGTVTSVSTMRGRYSRGGTLWIRLPDGQLLSLNTSLATA
jgi:hypothetical protein